MNEQEVARTMAVSLIVLGAMLMMITSDPLCAALVGLGAFVGVRFGG